MGVWLAVSVIRIVEKTGPKKGQTGGLNRPMALHVADSDQRCFLRKNPKSFTRRFFTHAGCTQLFSVSDRGVSRDPARSPPHAQGKGHRFECLSRKCAVSREVFSSETSYKTGERLAVV